MTMRPLSAGERAILSQDGPDDCDQFVVLNERRNVARKHHECSGCDGGWIKPGETYHRIVGLADGRFEINRYCLIAGCDRDARAWQERQRAMDEAYDGVWR